MNRIDREALLARAKEKRAEMMKQREENVDFKERFSRIRAAISELGGVPTLAKLRTFLELLKEIIGFKL